MHDKINFFVILFFLYLATALTYIGQYVAFPAPTQLHFVGLLIALSGYVLLSLHSYIEGKCRPAFEKQPKEDKKLLSYDLKVIAYSILASYFIGSYLYPISFSVHGYNILAAVGFFLLLLGSTSKNQVLIDIGRLIVILYNLIGGISYGMRHGFHSGLDVSVVALRLTIAIVTFYGFKNGLYDTKKDKH